MKVTLVAREDRTNFDNLVATVRKVEKMTAVSQVKIASTEEEIENMSKQGFNVTGQPTAVIGDKALLVLNPENRRNLHSLRRAITQYS